MRLIRTVPLLAVALLAGWASQAIAQGQRPPGLIESSPLPPPPGAVGVPRQVPGPTQGQVPPAGTAQQRPPPGAARPPGTGTPPAQPVPNPPPAAAAPPPDANGDVLVVEPPAQKIPNPLASFAGLDKITGRTTTFDVAIGETAQFGALQVTPRACYTRPATETQNTTAFAEVNEVTLQGQAKRIFTGWMFASSPGLHAVEHPIYDVWLIGCKASAPGTGRPAGQQ
ncbi:DUF2155 domain-containing protein [Xanthobacter autotrophicus DSM 431]|uniref:DUF2155 domain-containing protein n=1 Tax=Xanthobacter nonsaccharivorans TaxID=3119912 RepID=UPI00372AC46E